MVDEAYDRVLCLLWLGQIFVIRSSGGRDEFAKYWLDPIVVGLGYGWRLYSFSIVDD
jgi:hypothetical protein